jgi:hypothetical protein
MGPDVASTNRTQQSIDQGMGNCVPVRVTGQARVPGYRHSTQDEAASFLESV